jgi:hypothetical protein
MEELKFHYKDEFLYEVIELNFLQSEKVEYYHLREVLAGNLTMIFIIMFNSK